MFIPGLTEERDFSWKEDYTEQYDLRQDYNSAKRNEKKWKKKAELYKELGDTEAYKKAKAKQKYYAQKKKEIDEKRKALDKKQREERFSKKPGKPFPPQTPGKGSKPKAPFTEEQAKKVADIKKNLTIANEIKYNRDKNLSNGYPSWSITGGKGKIEILDKYVEEGGGRQAMSNKILDLVSKLSKGKLDRDDLDSIQVYSSNFYKEINGFLRGLKWDKSYEGAIKAHIAQLDKVFGKVQLEKDVYGFRGTSWRGLFGNNEAMWQDMQRNPSKYIGYKFTEQAYSSMSPNWDAIESFTKSADVIMHIHAKTGTKAISIKDWSAYKWEDEILLDKNSTFVIKDIVNQVWHEDDYHYSITDGSKPDPNTTMDSQIHVMVEVISSK